MDLIERDEGEVFRQIRKATEWNKEDLLAPKVKNKEQVNRLVVTFHPDVPLLTCTLHNNQYVINTSPTGCIIEATLIAYYRSLTLGIF